MGKRHEPHHHHRQVPSTWTSSSRAGARARPRQGREHGHEHGQGHGHGEAHEHRRGFRARGGGGGGEVIFFDAFSGVAGDMIIAALLISACRPRDSERAVAALPIADFHLHRGHAAPERDRATKFDVHVRRAARAPYGEIDGMLRRGAPRRAHARSRAAIFRRLSRGGAGAPHAPRRTCTFTSRRPRRHRRHLGGRRGRSRTSAEGGRSPLRGAEASSTARHGVLPAPPAAPSMCLRGVRPTASTSTRSSSRRKAPAIIATVSSRFERWPTFAPEASVRRRHARAGPIGRTSARRARRAPGRGRRCTAEHGGPSRARVHVIGRGPTSTIHGEIAGTRWRRSSRRARSTRGPRPSS